MGGGCKGYSWAVGYAVGVVALGQKKRRQSGEAAVSGKARQAALHGMRAGEAVAAKQAGKPVGEGCKARRQLTQRTRSAKSINCSERTNQRINPDQTNYPLLLIHIEVSMYRWWW